MSTTLPLFNSEGMLPPGDYEISFSELRQSSLVRGPTGSGNYPAWDSAWRAKLVDSLATLTQQLWQVGVDEVFADGSFVEDKDHPNDIDGYFICDLNLLKTGDLARRLNLLDPHKVWT